MDSLKGSPLLKGWLAARMLLGIIFIFSGYEKLVSPQQNFQHVLEEYQVFPRIFEKGLPQILPWIEFILGIFLSVGLQLRFSLSVALVMICSFIIIVAQAILRQLPIMECGCFGEQFSLPLHLVLLMDSVLFLLTSALLLNPAKSGHWSPDKFMAR